MVGVRRVFAVLAVVAGSAWGAEARELREAAHGKLVAASGMADAFAEEAARVLLAKGAKQGSATLVLASTNDEVQAMRSLYERWHAWRYSDEDGAKKAPTDERFRVFSENAAYVVTRNQDMANAGGDLTFRLGLGAMADLSHDEFLKTRLGVDSDEARQRIQARLHESGFEPAPKNFGNTSVDWRQEPHVAVTSVKNQEMCGACWAFSAVGAIEGVQALATDTYPPVSLSEQELLDCDTKKDMGCGGGIMDNAFEWVISNGGLDTYADWKYKARRDVKEVDGEQQPYCDPNRVDKHAASIDSYEDVLPRNSEVALMEAVQKQPVSIAIQANHRDFQLYSGGIFADASCGTMLDHGVVLVGYGTDGSGENDYWIVKNSWSDKWGEDGYIRLATGVAPKGICGIASMASVPKKSHGDNPSPPPAPPTPPSPPPPPPPPPANTCTGEPNGPSCPSSATCCCALEIGSHCLIWGCCPMQSAICCDDHRHCCPQEFPVCGEDKCEKKAGSGYAAEWMPLQKVGKLEREPAFVQYA